jgi:hypothetical protein
MNFLAQFPATALFGAVAFVMIFLSFASLLFDPRGKHNINERIEPNQRADRTDLRGPANSHLANGGRIAAPSD